MKKAKAKKDEKNDKNEEEDLKRSRKSVTTNSAEEIVKEKEKDFKSGAGKKKKEE